jgi:hypothetical protein
MAFRFGSSSVLAEWWAGTATRAYGERVTCLLETRVPADGQGDRGVAARSAAAGDAILAHTLVLEAVDCLNGASALVADAHRTALCRYAEELIALAAQLPAADR